VVAEPFANGADAWQVGNGNQADATSADEWDFALPREPVEVMVLDSATDAGSGNTQGEKIRPCVHRALRA
jgi:hypothetical protein